MNTAVSQSSSRPAGMGRDPSLDLLKAVSIIMVTIWHLKPLQFAELGTGKAYLVLQGLNATFWHEVTLLAVPVFYIVSLYLFLRKACGGFQYFRNRTERLVQVFFFWMAVQCALFVAVTGGLPELTWFNFRMGSPNIPGAGHNGFYFIFNLIALNLLAYMYTKLDSRRQDLLDVGIIAVTLAVFQVATVSSAIHLKHYSILNFLIYISLARQLVVRREWTLGKRWVFLGLYAAFALQDMAMYMLAGQWPGHYSRPTVVFGALACITFAGSLQVRLPGWVQKVAVYSLGIYALHINMGFMAQSLLGLEGMFVLDNAGFLWPELVHYAFAALLLAIALWGLSHTPLKRFIR